MGSDPLTSNRPLLRDPDLDAGVQEEGFVVVRGAARGLVRDLRRVHRNRGPRVPPPGFHSTMYSPDAAHKITVHNDLVAVLTPLLDELFVGYRPMLANFVTKVRGGENGIMPPHQDWTFVDEVEGSSLNVWIPLVDVNRRNGGISVLPRSHRLPRTIRGTDTPDPFQGLGERLDDWMVELPMSAGDVLVHDHRVLHGSPPNLRRRPRLATACAVVAEDAQLVHHALGEDGLLRRYLIEDSFFVRHTFGRPDFPSDVVFDRLVDFTNPAISDDDVASLWASAGQERVR